MTHSLLAEPPCAHLDAPPRFRQVAPPSPVQAEAGMSITQLAPLAGALLIALLGVSFISSGPDQAL